MKKEIFEEIISNLEIKKNEWTDFYEIDSILLKSGCGIYPDWKHLRFLITDGGDILVKHGDSYPYGARLTCDHYISVDGKTLTFNPKNTVPSNEYYENFRLPKPGDIIRSTEGNKCFSEAVVIKASMTYNSFVVDLVTSIDIHKIDRLSFYDPGEFSKEFCMHSAPIEGIYMKFKENKGKANKKYGVFHQIIKLKDIDSINLKITSKYKNKILNVRG